MKNSPQEGTAPRRLRNVGPWSTRVLGVQSREVRGPTGRYELLERLSEGGMGTVYRARQHGEAGFARIVAIKRLLPQFARDAEFVQQFATEARVASLIHHANVVQTLDVVQESGELWIVMEYVEGCTLSSLLVSAATCANERDRMSVPLVAAVLLGALAGLAAAHDAVGEDGRALRIVHGDFSPQNILVGYDGVARVLDFGLARLETSQVLARETGLRGKLGYLAPEQVSGQLADQRSDVFSAGVVLWEALCGRRLFGGGNLSDSAVLTNVLSRPVDPPSVLNPQIGSDIDAVVLRALQRDRDLRFPSARALSEALRRVVAPATTQDVEDFLFGAEVTKLRNARLRPPSREANCGPRLALPAQTRRDRPGAEPATQNVVNRLSEKTEVDKAASVEQFAYARGKAPRGEEKLTPARPHALANVVSALALAIAGVALMRQVVAQSPLSDFAQSRPPVGKVAEAAPSPVTSAAATRAVPSATASVVMNRELMVETVPKYSQSPDDARASPHGPSMVPPNSRLATGPDVTITAEGTSATEQRPTRGASSPIDCRDPVFVDREGIRHFKKECL